MTAKNDDTPSRLLALNDDRWSGVGPMQRRASQSATPADFLLRSNDGSRDTERADKARACVGHLSTTSTPVMLRKELSVYESHQDRGALSDAAVDYEYRHRKTSCAASCRTTNVRCDRSTEECSKISTV